MSFEVWAEKYRPKRLDDIINQKHIVARIKVFVEDRNIPHMLFAGPPGTGKTTMALCIARELYGDQWRQNVLETNASDERGIGVVRGKIKDFARTIAMGGAEYRMIILDEADALTSEAQQALRRTMETYSATVRFILICNYSSKIIPPIQSRTAVFRFRTLSEEDVRKFIGWIVQGENLEVEEEAVKAIMHLCEGDLRRVANLLQAAATLGSKITEEMIYEVASQARPQDVRRMLQLALNGRFKDAREILYKMLVNQGLAGEDVVREIHRQVYALDLPEEAKIRLVEAIGEYEFRISEGADALIQLEALLARFAAYGASAPPFRGL
ncbi:replication factor C small subunit [Candidatus Bathyarchaeota archaeon]|nr:MAG: Replication factor C small subunit [Candidatus Bathyarchaeota archaeon ex4484_40]RJS79136.1 MAG: replication factor C small subunit [Candidatus Bathyarchaeota archaeon]